MTHIQLTDEQRKNIKEFADATALKMSWEISNYIENEIVKSYDVDHNRLLQETGAVLTAETPAPEVVTPDNFTPVTEVPATEYTPPTEQVTVLPADFTTPEFTVPEPTLQPISEPTSDFNTPAPDNNFNIPATEVADVSAATFGSPITEPAPASFDGSDLNYSAPPTDNFATPAPEPMSFNAPTSTDFPAPPAEIATPEVVPELDLPAPLPTPDVPNIPVSTPAPTPAYQEAAAAKPAFSKGHDLLGKVLSKGWGKKNQ